MTGRSDESGDHVTAKTFPDDTWRDVVHDYWTVVRWHFLWRPRRAFFRWLSRMGLYHQRRFMLDDLAAVLAAPELPFRCTCGALVREWRHWERSLRCDDCASLAVECPACGETWHTCEAVA